MAKKKPLTDSLAEVPETKEPDLEQAKSEQKEDTPVVEEKAEDLTEITEVDQKSINIETQKKLDEAQAKYIELSDENKKLSAELGKTKKALEETKKKLEEEQKRNQELVKLTEKISSEVGSTAEYEARIQTLKDKIKDIENTNMDNGFIVAKLQSENDKLRNELIQIKKYSRRPKRPQNPMLANDDTWN